MLKKKLGDNYPKPGKYTHLGKSKQIDKQSSFLYQFPILTWKHQQITGLEIHKHSKIRDHSNNKKNNPKNCFDIPN